MNIAAIVMASGLSKRMGENKLLLNLNNKPLVQHVFDTIKACDFKETIVVSCYEEILERASCNNMKTLYNLNAHLGQSQSIVLGTQWIKANCENIDGIMFFPGDIPYIKPDVVNKLISCFTKHPDLIIRPRYHYEDIQSFGNPVIFPKRFIEDLCELKGDHGGKSIINNHAQDVMIIDIQEGKQGFDIDTKEEFQRFITTS